MQHLRLGSLCGDMVVASTRRFLHAQAFMAAHRTKQNSFTRQRLLTFPRLCALIIQKTARSAHAHLVDFFSCASLPGRTPTVSAWTQARAKLSHTAFIELNEKAILANVYKDTNAPALRRWRGLRLLAIDTSLLRLPAHETVIKGRLDLEHFSGQTLEAVLQDIHATVYLCNLESILIGPAQEEMSGPLRPTEPEPHVNHAVAFHAIKHEAIELLLGDQDLGQTPARLKEIFLRNAQKPRPGRSGPRQSSIARGYHFQRNVRKFVY